MRNKVRLIAMLVVFFALWGVASHVETHYTRQNCEVVEYTENVVSVVDECGYLWDFEADGLELGDVVDIKMYTNHTDNDIFDDEIIGYKLVSDWREVE